jgi:hypothetical protein
VIRSSKGGTQQEDYFVDAVEVVSFGQSFFYRSLERPRPFLVPVSDYEVLELKETRTVLKNASMERPIKIAGGKDASKSFNGTSQIEAQPQSSEAKKGDRRRRNRRGRDRQELNESAPQEETTLSKESPIDEELDENTMTDAIESKAPSVISKLFPPPSTLIRDKLSRYEPKPTSSQDQEEAIAPLYEASTSSSSANEEDFDEEQ